MKVLCWNINHRICEKPMHPLIFELIRSTSLDVILFNEFVDGPSRREFKTFLSDQGFQYHHTTPTHGRHNQIFIATKAEHTLLSPTRNPPIEPIASNQCIFDCSQVVFYTLRVPAYKTINEKRLAWSYYLNEINALKPNVVVGDFNIDSKAKDQSFSESLLGLGYRYHFLEGASFWTNKGLPKTIDHLFTRGLEISNATFLASLNVEPIVGKTSAFASDHCPILFEASISLFK